MFSLDRERDTICAQSTAPGIGALAIIRLSGAQSLAILKALSPEIPESKIESHRANYSFLKDPSNDAIVDEIVATYFEAGRSFTGEDSVEFSCHGSAIIISEILRLMVSHGARMADPGEFTYRAFSNGRIDLIQAESVLQLIESRSKSAAKSALRQLRGGLSQKVTEICDDLTWGLSRLEANIDFSAEDIEFASEESIYEHLARAHENLGKAVNSYSSGRSLVEGIRVAIVGEPNVGKSSLLNRLISEDRAIVSPYAGTTRDTIEAEAIISGARFVFIDTAGIRKAVDEIEALGIERSRAEVERADIILWVCDISSAPKDSMDIGLNLNKTVVRVINKGDLADTVVGYQAPEGAFLVSAKTGTGLEQLSKRLADFISIQISDEAPAVLSLRQFEMLKDSMDFVDRGLRLLRDRVSSEFVIAEIQSSLKVCMKVLGKEFDDEVIDRVFRDFCLGK